MANISSEVRRATLERDNFQCQECGSKIDPAQNKYVIHHLNYSPEDELTTLCRSCHLKIHKNGDGPNRPQTTISINKETRDQLFKMMLKMSIDYNRRVTYDDVIQHLFTRRLISLRQGE